MSFNLFICEDLSYRIIPCFLLLDSLRSYLFVNWRLPLKLLFVIYVGVDFAFPLVIVVIPRKENFIRSSLRNLLILS